MKLLLLCFLLIASSLHAKTVQLKTGHWIFDRYRNVTLDEFDYTYSIYSVDYENGFFELDDGSIWQIKPMEDEPYAEPEFDLLGAWRSALKLL